MVASSRVQGFDLDALGTFDGAERVGIQEEVIARPGRLRAAVLAVAGVWWPGRGASGPAPPGTDRATRRTPGRRRRPGAGRRAGSTAGTIRLGVPEEPASLDPFDPEVPHGGRGGGPRRGPAAAVPGRPGRAGASAGWPTTARCGRRRTGRRPRSRSAPEPAGPTATPITADDLRFTLETIRSPAWPGPRAGYDRLHGRGGRRDRRSRSASTGRSPAGGGCSPAPTSCCPPTGWPGKDLRGRVEAGARRVRRAVPARSGHAGAVGRPGAQRRLVGRPGQGGGDPGAGGARRADDGAAAGPSGARRRLAAGDGQPDRALPGPGRRRRVGGRARRRPRGAGGQHRRPCRRNGAWPTSGWPTGTGSSTSPGRRGRPGRVAAGPGGPGAGGRRRPGPPPAWNRSAGRLKGRRRGDPGDGRGGPAEPTAWAGSCRRGARGGRGHPRAEVRRRRPTVDGAWLPEGRFDLALVRTVAWPEPCWACWFADDSTGRGNVTRVRGLTALAAAADRDPAAAPALEAEGESRRPDAPPLAPPSRPRRPGRDRPRGQFLVDRPLLGRRILDPSGLWSCSEVARCCSTDDQFDAGHALGSTGRRPNWRSSPRHDRGEERQLPGAQASQRIGVHYRAMTAVRNASSGDREVSFRVGPTPLANPERFTHRICGISARGPGAVLQSTERRPIDVSNPEGLSHGTAISLDGLTYIGPRTARSRYASAQSCGSGGIRQTR